MTKIIQNCVSIVLALVAIAILFFAMLTGLNKQSEVTCIKLQNQSQEYRGFYITESEDTMCDSIGIEVDAPVRGVDGEIIR